MNRVPALPAPTERRLSHAAISSSGVTVIAAAHRSGVPCPRCGTLAQRIHSRFRQVASTWLRVSRKETKVALSLPGALSFTVGSTSLSPRAVTALDSVAKVLIAGGVAAERILVAGYGSTNPVAPNVTEEGRDANRRVEIEVSPLRPAGIRQTRSTGHR